MAVYDVFKSLGTESFIDMDNGAESSDCFCELCSLDFTTHRVSARFGCSLHEMFSFPLFSLHRFIEMPTCFDGFVTL